MDLGTLRIPRGGRTRSSDSRKRPRENSANFRSKTEIHYAFTVCENGLVPNLRDGFADRLPQHDLQIQQNSGVCLFPIYPLLPLVEVQ